MKGIVFTEFIEMVEDTFSPDLADQIIEESDLPSGGAYTAVATYDHAEILQMVTHLSEHTKIPIAELVHAFGKHLVGRFNSLYPAFFAGVEDTFAFLSTIENHVHVEVKKLYPDAELPTFETEQPDDATLIMIYRSFRPFADLAAGLIQGSIEHFNEQISLERESMNQATQYAEKFTLKKLTG